MVFPDHCLFYNNFICLYSESFFFILNTIYMRGAIMVVIVWQLDLQLAMQSVPITNNVMSLNPADGEVYNIR